MFGGLISKYRSMSLPAKAGLWFTVCSIAQRGISVISMPIFTRMLSADEYGTYSLYTSWYMLFSLVVTLNLAAEVFNKGLIDHENEKSDYTISQSTLITVLAVGFYILYVLFHKSIDALTGMSVLLTSLMFLDIYTTTIVSLWFARKRFDYAYKPLFAVTVGISLASIVVGIVAVWLAPDEWKVVARVASNILPSFVISVFVLVGFLSKSHRFFDSEWWRKSLRMGVPLVPHYASQVLLNQSDKVLISWFMDMVSVAIYGVAHSAGLLLVMVNNGINSSFVPWLYGRLRSKNYGNVAGIANVLVLIVLTLVFCLMLLAPECVSILAAEGYRDAIWCIPPIATGVVFAFVYTLFVNVEIYYGNTSYVAMASLLSAVLNLVLNWVLIPRFGYVASAWVTSVCYLATAGLHFLFMKRSLRGAGVSERVYDSRTLFAICGLALVCAAISLLLYLTGAFRYVVIGVFAVIVFLLRGKIRSALNAIRS